MTEDQKPSLKPPCPDCPKNQTPPRFGQCDACIRATIAARQADGSLPTGEGRR